MALRRQKAMATLRLMTMVLYALSDFRPTHNLIDSVDTRKTPLLTTFTPAVEQGSHFTISVHAWVPTLLSGMRDGDTAHKKFLWTIRVMVDGNCVA
jgi:hypothetical protein